jgi:hypothetical protein
LHIFKNIHGGLKEDFRRRQEFFSGTPFIFNINAPSGPRHGFFHPATNEMAR